MKNSYILDRMIMKVGSTFYWSEIWQEPVQKWGLFWMVEILSSIAHHHQSSCVPRIKEFGSHYMIGSLNFSIIGSKCRQGWLGIDPHSLSWGSSYMHPPPLKKEKKGERIKKKKLVKHWDLPWMRHRTRGQHSIDLSICRSLIKNSFHIVLPMSLTNSALPMILVLECGEPDLRHGSKLNFSLPLFFYFFHLNR